MSVDHMGMVFRAQGLDGGEKLLLLAYANHTDAHGYCWPSEQRLADSCGTSLSTVARQKRSLKAKGLLKSVRRINPRTGEPITNLTRINLPLLESMRRPDRSYDDDMVHQITFKEEQDGPDLLKCHSDRYSPSDRQVPPANMAGTPRQSDRQNLIESSVEPSPPPPRASLELVPSAAEGQGGGGGDAPQQEKEQDATAAAFVDRLPYRGKLPNKQQRRRLIAGVTAALESGWNELTLRVELTEETKSADSLTAVYLHRLKPDVLSDAPPAPRATVMPSGGGDQRPRCSECGTLIRKSAGVPDQMCKECRAGQAAPVPTQREVLSVDNGRGAALARGSMADKAVRPRT